MNTRPPGVARMGYQPGLDGLRALSVILVILYHAGVVRDAEAPAGTLHRWFFDGGFLGVEVFFVVSGFLITSLMLEERATTGRVVLHRFWFRRFRRLLPALWVMILATGVWATLWGGEYLGDLKWDAFFGLFYGANFQQLFGDVSYFGGFPHLLRHLWSLAVEEHFYLLFPLVFAVVLRRRSTPERWLLRVVVPAAIVSAGLLVAIWQRPVERLGEGGVVVDDARQNWAYLSTFTRIAGILIGVSLAVVWSPWKRAALAQLDAERRGGRHLDVAGLVAMGLVVAASLTLTTESALLYRGGLTAVSLLSAVAIAAVVDPRARVMHAVFANPVMAAIGRRSYGLYLWHWPIFVGPLSGRSMGERLLIGGAATVVASELCYRFVETPIRQGALRRWFLALDTSWARRRGRLRFAVPTVACVAGVALLAGALTVRLVTVDRRGIEEAAGPVEQFDADAVLSAVTVPGSLDATAATPTDQTGSAAAARLVRLQAPPIPVPAELPPLPRRMVIVGDSTANSLYHNLPDGLSGTFRAVNGSLQGCGLFDEGALVTSLPGYALDFERCDGWQDQWERTARAAYAEVALVMVGAWDVFDMVIDGQTLTFGSPEFDAYWTEQLRSGIDALRASGAEVALLEIGCMRPQNVKGQGTPALPERADDTRVTHLNELLVRAATADPQHVYFVPGPVEWCADEAIATDLFYRWDGVHASRKGGKLVMEAIAPELLSIPVVPGAAQGPIPHAPVAEAPERS